MLHDDARLLLRVLVIINVISRARVSHRLRLNLKEVAINQSAFVVLTMFRGLAQRLRVAIATRLPRLNLAHGSIHRLVIRSNLRKDPGMYQAGKRLHCLCNLNLNVVSKDAIGLVKGKTNYRRRDNYRGTRGPAAVRSLCPVRVL